MDLNSFINKYNNLNQSQLDCIKGFIEEDFLPCIEDSFKNQEKEEVKFFIAGGALTSTLTRKDINDFDIYFYNGKDIEKYTKGIEKYATLLYETHNAITYNISGEMFQVCKLTGSPQDIFKMYDFTINMCALEFSYNIKTKVKTYNVVFNERFLPDLISRRLVFNDGTLYPISSLFRVDKYKKRGYTIEDSQLFKIALRIADLELKSTDDIKKQTIGFSEGILMDTKCDVISKVVL